MTTLDYFQFKNCYDLSYEEFPYNQEGVLGHRPFEEYKYDNFRIIPIKNDENCHIHAFNDNAQFFLLSDACGNTKTANCYIPKKNIGNNYLSNTLQQLLQPFNTILNDFLGISGGDGGKIVTDSEIDVCHNFVIQNKCLQYLPSDNYFGRKNVFALYTSKIINNNMATHFTDTKNYTHYAVEYDNIKNIPTSEFETLSGELRLAFENYICDDSWSDYYQVVSGNVELIDGLDMPNLNNLISDVSGLSNLYVRLFNYLDEISYDSSNIKILTEYDNLFIEQLNKSIDSKKQELKHLLASGGGNNGRLDDTNYLKNLKFIEIIIVVLVLLIAIFIYFKKK